MGVQIWESMNSEFIYWCAKMSLIMKLRVKWSLNTATLWAYSQKRTQKNPARNSKQDLVFLKCQITFPLQQGKELVINS